MLYALICKDKPDSLDVRMDARPDHVAFLQALNAAGQLKLAGPFLDDAGKPCGSLVVVEAADRDAAWTLAAGDPYAKAALFAHVDIQPWSWTFNNPEA